MIETQKGNLDKKVKKKTNVIIFFAFLARDVCLSCAKDLKEVLNDQHELEPLTLNGKQE